MIRSEIEWETETATTNQSRLEAEGNDSEVVFRNHEGGIF